MNAQEITAYLSLVDAERPAVAAAIRHDGLAAFQRTLRDGVNLGAALAATLAATELACIVRLEQPAGFLL